MKQLTEKQIEILKEIHEDENGRFKNGVDFPDDESVIIYAMNREFVIREILVNLDDLRRIAKRYSSISINGSGYAYGVRRDNGKLERLHRFIHGFTEKGFVVDHRSGDKLDNRKTNLRKLTVKENLQAYRKPASKSGFRNVFKKPNGNFSVYIRKNGRLISFGTYRTAEEANAVAIAKRAEIFGNLEGSVIK